MDGVAVIGVDEHVRRHTRGDKYVTVIIDLTRCATRPVLRGFSTCAKDGARRRSSPAGDLVQR